MGNRPGGIKNAALHPPRAAPFGERVFPLPGTGAGWLRGRRGRGGHRLAFQPGPVQGLYRSRHPGRRRARAASARTRASSAIYSACSAAAPSNPADAVVDAFHAKADQAAKGNEPAPEPAPADPMAQGLRARLVARHRARARTSFPTKPPAPRPIMIAGCWTAAPPIFFRKPRLAAARLTLRCWRWKMPPGPRRRRCPLR